MSYKNNQLVQDFERIHNADEIQRNIEEKENTLMKYFIEEKINDSQAEKHSQLSFDKIDLFYKMPIKLRNTLKKCYWDRQGIVIFIILRIAPFT